MPEGQIVPGSIYIYAPNKAAPVFFSVAFAILGGVHLWQCYRYKSWLLTGLQPLCCIMFTVGFILREYGAFNYFDTTLNLNIYIASTCLIFMAPASQALRREAPGRSENDHLTTLTVVDAFMSCSPLLELANYHVLGHIFYFVPYCAPLHPGRVLTTFGLLSSLVEALNAIGVSYLANRSLPEKTKRVGDSLMKAGLCLQLAVIGLFYVCAGVFHHRCAKKRLTSNRKLTIPLHTMYISTALVMTRTIYRIVEYFGESSLETSDSTESIGTILRYEWFFYVFEASVMLINVIMWSILHPRRFLPGNSRVFLERDSITETEGPGWEDNRMFLATVIDPFGWFRRGSEKA